MIDLFQVGTEAGIGIATIVTIKVDIAWIKNWMKTHAEADSESFKRVDADLREIRNRL